jgi:hypothetical protein
VHFQVGVGLLLEGFFFWFFWHKRKRNYWRVWGKGKFLLGQTKASCAKEMLQFMTLLKHLAHSNYSVPYTRCMNMYIFQWHKETYTAETCMNIFKHCSTVPIQAWMACLRHINAHLGRRWCENCGVLTLTPKCRQCHFVAYEWQWTYVGDKGRRFFIHWFLG